MRSNKYWDTRALQRYSDVEKMTEPYIKQMMRLYTRANKVIDNDIANIYNNYSKATGLDIQTLKTLLSKKETDKFWKTLEGKGLKKYVKNNYKARISRLEQLQAQIYAKAIELTANTEHKINTNAYQGVINQGYNRTIYDISKGTGYDFAFNKLDDNTVKALLNRKFYGKNYSERIWGNTEILADKLSVLLGGALLSGTSPEKTINQVNKVFNTGYSNAQRLIRTEVNYFYNEAEGLAYEELGVDEYVFLATLDSRTSPVCQGMDNKRFKLTEKTVGVNYPPLHPYCRSTVRAFIDEDVEKTLKRKAKDIATGKIEEIGNLSYPEWLKSKGIQPVKEVTKEVKRGIIKYKDVTEFFKGGINLKGIDEDYQKEIKDEFLKIVNKYDIGALDNTILGTNKATSNLGYHKRGISAEYDYDKRAYKVMFDDKLALAKAYYQNKETSITSHRINKELNKKPYDSDLSTLWHEYGHFIDSTYTLKKYPQLERDLKRVTETLTNGRNVLKTVDWVKENADTIRDFNEILKKPDSLNNIVYNELYEIAKKHSNREYYSTYSFDNEIIANFGKYAGSKKSEFLAEAFTTVNLIPDDEQTFLQKEFKKIFDKHFKDMFGGG